MHPDKNKLIEYIEGSLDAGSIDLIKSHLVFCEFCREFCDDYNSLIGSLARANSEIVPQAAWEMAKRLYEQAFGAKVIPLILLRVGNKAEGKVHLLAADGNGSPSQGVINLATLYSEEPELVLRLMRDSERNENYLQLIGEIPSQVAHVMVQIPELDRDFITDKHGRARIMGDFPEKYDQLKWQVRLPDSVFELEPLQYDPDKVEYSKDILLETEKGDKVRIGFQGKTEGKQIVIQILELDGKPDFGNIRAIIARQNEHQIFEARPGKSIILDATPNTDTPWTTFPSKVMLITLSLIFILFRNIHI